MAELPNPENSFEKYVTDHIKKAQTKGRFRIRAKALFLTYSILNIYECINQKEQFIEYIKRLFPEATYILGGRENYKDRVDAFHNNYVVVVFDRAKNYTRPDFAYLVVRHEGRSYRVHGNYMAAKMLSNAMKYVEKEKNTIDYGEFSHCKITII